MEIDRRAVLASAGALATVGLGAETGARARRPLGLADITVRKELAADYAGTLRKVAAMGYTHFGFRLADPAPGGSEPSPADKARMMRDAGLQPGVARFSPIGADYPREIAQAAETGARTVAMTIAQPFLAGRPVGSTTRAAFDAWLPRLAEIGGQCRAAGLTFAFHNHWWDLLPLGGETPLDIMARSISPRDLSFELDLAWTWYAGVAPLDLLARLGPRVVSMHLKDVDRSRGAGPNKLAVGVGQGEMGYAALLPRVARLTSAVGYVEVDAPADGLKAAADAVRFVREHRW